MTANVNALLMKQRFGALKILSIMMILAGCASNRNLPDWRIQLSFEDDSSCGYYRDLQIFDDGRVTYAISHLGPAYSKTFKIGKADVTSLVSQVKTFPTERSQFANRDITNRGGTAELRILRDELTKMANIRWEDLSAHRKVCPQASRSLPSGQIALRDDF